MVLDTKRATTHEKSLKSGKAVDLEPRDASALVASGRGREVAIPNTDEVFRGLYTRAGFGVVPEVLAVCSALNGEGKTTLSLGLAITLAQDFPDKRVLVVETDPEHASMVEDFGLQRGPGLYDWLCGDASVSLEPHATFLDNLDLLPAGTPVAGRGRPLRSARMGTLIEALRENYEHVILDTPAILTNSDAVLLTELADGAVLVVRTGVAPHSVVQRALQQIDEAKLRGVVLNGVQSAIPGWMRRLFGF